jgi:histidinol phosphatase-like enzyme (inositol monophosphatase family)
MLADKLIDLAHRLADASAEVIRPLFRGDLQSEYKQASSPIVTIADRQAERVMRELIEQYEPTHGIIGEEFGTKPAQSPYTWVLDPIDGTIAFSTGKPLFGTLIALLQEDQPVLGVINQPVLQERWLGIGGAATTLNGQIVRTKSNPELAQAALGSTSPYLFKTPAEQNKLETLRQNVHITSFGGDCYQFGLLAAGHLDIILECGLALHDFAALIPVIQGSGGVITDWSGHPLGTGSTGDVLVCANRELHQQVLDLWN